MKNIRNKVLLIFGLSILFIIVAIGNVKAATFSISSSTATVEPGGSFSVTISTNGAGYVNLTCTNGVLSKSYLWVEGSETVTCKAANSGSKVTIKASGKIGDFDTEKDEEKSGSVSVTIKEKTKEEITPTKSTTNTQTTNTTNKNTTKKEANNTKNTTNTKTNTNTKTEKNTTNKNIDVVVNEEDQGTKEELLIEDMNVFTVNEEGEKTLAEISPKFDSKTLEYELNVQNNIEKIEIDSKYNSKYELKIEGLEEPLKEGENTVKITIIREKESKIYTIKVIKEEKKIEEDDIEKNEIEEPNKKDEDKNLTFSISEFIWIILAIVVVENLLVFSIYKVVQMKKQGY